MTEFLITVVIFFIGVVVGLSAESDNVYKKCVKANQHISVGEIKEFCNERLYRK